MISELCKIGFLIRVDKGRDFFFEIFKRSYWMRMKTKEEFISIDDKFIREHSPIQTGSII